MNAKKIKQFLALYDEYMLVRPKYELARIEAEEQGLAPLQQPEIKALADQVEGLRDAAWKQFGIAPAYFGLIGREVRRLAEA